MTQTYDALTPAEHGRLRAWQTGSPRAAERTTPRVIRPSEKTELTVRILSMPAPNRATPWRDDTSSRG